MTLVGQSIRLTAEELAAMIERVRADERQQIVDALRSYNPPVGKGASWPYAVAADFIEGRP